jgi:hypothetical protein
MQQHEYFVVDEDPMALDVLALTWPFSVLLGRFLSF